MRGTENFDICCCFFLLFLATIANVLSLEEILGAKSPLIFEIFIVFCNFLVLCNGLTPEATRIKSVLYQISGSVLILTNQSCN